MFMYSARPTMSISQYPRSYEYSIIILIGIGKKCMIYIKIHTEDELRGGGGFVIFIIAHYICVHIYTFDSPRHIFIHNMINYMHDTPSTHLLYEFLC